MCQRHSIGLHMNLITHSLLNDLSELYRKDNYFISKYFVKLIWGKEIKLYKICFILYRTNDSVCPKIMFYRTAR